MRVDHVIKGCLIGTHRLFQHSCQCIIVIYVVWLCAHYNFANNKQKYSKYSYVLYSSNLFRLLFSNTKLWALTIFKHSTAFLIFWNCKSRCWINSMFVPDTYLHWFFFIQTLFWKSQRFERVAPSSMKDFGKKKIAFKIHSKGISIWLENAILNQYMWSSQMLTYYGNNKQNQRCNTRSTALSMLHMSLSSYHFKWGHSIFFICSNRFVFFLHFCSSLSLMNTHRYTRTHFSYNFVCIHHCRHTEWSVNSSWNFEKYVLCATPFARNCSWMCFVNSIRFYLVKPCTLVPPLPSFQRWLLITQKNNKFHYEKRLQFIHKLCLSNDSCRSPHFNIISNIFRFSMRNRGAGNNLLLRCYV